MVLPWSATGQTAYPSKPIRLVVPFGAGSSPDVIGRLLGERLARSIGQPVVIDNKPGASTIIGAQAVATAPADGHTLLYTVNNTTSINPFVYKALPYKPESFVPVIRVLSVPYMLVVAANAPYRTTADLVSAAKATPGKLNYASYGIGQGTHVAMARFLNAAGVTMTHVPYKDGGLTDLMSGLVTTSFEPSTTAIPQIKAGKLRALAVSGPRRIDVMPDVPTIAETIPGFVGDSWHGILAPEGTPAAAVSRIAALSQDIIESAEFQARLRELGLVPANTRTESFRKFLADDAAAWAAVVKANDIKVD